MPKAEKPRSNASKRSNPLKRPALEAQLQRDQETGTFRPAKASKLSSKQSSKQSADLSDDDDNVTEDLVPRALSKKIMHQAHDQQQEEADDVQDGADIEDEDDHSAKRPNQKSRKQANRQPQPISLRAQSNDDNHSSDEEVEEYEEDEIIDDIELSAEAEASLSQFLPAQSTERRSLADMILDSIAAHEAAKSKTSEPSDNTPRVPVIDPKIVAVYQQMAIFLSHYTSGKIPKAFKIIPSLANWEQVLFLTNPEGWTCQATAAATRLFAGNLNEKMAQRFYSIILYPRIRSDINKHQGKLNYHLYQSMKHAIFKPAAFFRGIILPMCQEDLTPRESVILASVLAKYSISHIHAGVAMIKICEMEYTGPVCLVLKTLINKKYSLPLRVVNTVCDYFCAFAEDERKMPLIWHQTLLVFIQRYKAELTDKQSKDIRELCKVQNHAQISRDIKRELDSVALVGKSLLNQEPISTKLLTSVSQSTITVVKTSAMEMS